MMRSPCFRRRSSLFCAKQHDTGLQDVCDGRRREGDRAPVRCDHEAHGKHLQDGAILPYHAHKSTTSGCTMHPRSFANVNQIVLCAVPAACRQRGIHGRRPRVHKKRRVRRQHGDPGDVFLPLGAGAPQRRNAGGARHAEGRQARGQTLIPNPNDPTLVTFQPVPTSTSTCPCSATSNTVCSRGLAACAATGLALMADRLPPAPQLVPCRPPGSRTTRT